MFFFASKAGRLRHVGSRHPVTPGKGTRRNEGAKSTFCSPFTRTSLHPQHPTLSPPGLLPAASKAKVSV